jgi:predicted MFS family arabinose efflux permease
MYITSITSFAWLVKPFIGYLMDNYLDKRKWIFIALGFDIILVVLMGFLQLPIFIIVMILILNSTNAAFRDVATDGIMCVEGKAYKITGKIQSIQWISISVALLLTGIGGGYIAEKWSYQIGFLCLVPVYLLVAIPAYYYREADGSDGSAKKMSFIDLKKLLTDKRLLIICLFIFLYKYSPSFGTPLFFIQRDSFKWDKIWIGSLSTISTIFGIIGSVLYYRFSKKINIKKWLFISVFAGALTTLSYLYYTPTSAIIYDVVYSLMGMFIFLMIMDFMARSTTRGMEATSFAVLCSFSNIALVASNLTGAYLLPIVGLKWLIILSAATSFLCLFLINKIGEV